MSLILLVDDDPAILDYLSTALCDEGHEILTCDGGETALELSRQVQPDLMVVDAMMPRIDGYQLLWHLRHDELTKYIPAMMLTSRSRVQDQQQGMSLGAADYVFKPFSLEELVARIDKLLDRNRDEETALAEQRRA